MILTKNTWKYWKLKNKRNCESNTKIEQYQKREKNITSYFKLLHKNSKQKFAFIRIAKKKSFFSKL